MIQWLRNEKRADGPQGKIGFAIGARIVQHARKTLLRLAALADRIALWKEAMQLLQVAT
ncbi:MAG: hypothetical protein ACYCSN_08040 [Acidobacteriaceae bacterium]